MSSQTEAREEIALPIEGMNCASCVNRVEKNLNAVDGAEATVNFATHKAYVTYDPARAGLEDFTRAVAEAGYVARPEPTRAPGGTGPATRARTTAKPDHGEPRDAHDHMQHSVASVSTLAHRVIVSAILTVPLVLISMVPSLQFDYWQWVVFGLATPIVFWGGLPFHRSALRSARHGVTQMDTLISMGTLAAWTWSVYALLFGTAGEIGMTMPFDLIPDRDAALDHLYFEVAGVVTTLLLLGRYFEENAKDKAGRRPAQPAQPRRQGGGGPRRRRNRARGPGRRSPPRRPFRGPARGEGRHRRHRDRGRVGGRRVAWSPANPCRWRSGVGDGVVGASVNTSRTPRGRGDQGRLRHRPGPDRPAGRTGPDRQGTGPAAGRPDLRGLRADRDPAGLRHARVLAARSATAPPSPSVPRSAS